MRQWIRYRYEAIRNTIEERVSHALSNLALFAFIVEFAFRLSYTFYLKCANLQSQNFHIIVCFECFSCLLYGFCVCVFLFFFCERKLNSILFLRWWISGKGKFRRLTNNIKRFDISTMVKSNPLCTFPDIRTQCEWTAPNPTDFSSYSSGTPAGYCGWFVWNRLYLRKWNGYH